jgi:HAD superfamily hydrolase (TIGR01458 family)
MTTPPDRTGVLLDIDGVLYVGDEPIDGAAEALERLRARADGLMLVTNTTSRPRRAIGEHLRKLGFSVADDEILTPATIAIHHCRARGYQRVGLVVGDALLEDLAELPAAALADGSVDAVILGELGDAFGPATLNPALRALVAGAELLALGHNRVYARPHGLVLDVGAWSAALEYGSGREAVVLGKPSPVFFEAALSAIGVTAAEAVMVGDDIEADVVGALDAGLRGVLVRTGKFREGASAAREPTAILDSIADVPAWLRW